MKNVRLASAAIIFSALAFSSCQPEAEEETKTEPDVYELPKIDPAMEEAAAAESETIREAQKAKDEINAKTKEKEDKLKEIHEVLKGQ